MPEPTNDGLFLNNAIVNLRDPLTNKGNAKFESAVLVSTKNDTSLINQAAGNHALREGQRKHDATRCSVFTPVLRAFPRSGNRPDLEVGLEAQDNPRAQSPVLRAFSL